MTANDRLAAETALRDDPKLNGFPPDQLATILAAAEWHRVPAGTRLFSAGEDSSPVHAIASGFVAMESALAIPDLPLVTIMQGPFWVVGRPSVHGRMQLTTATARTDLIVGTIPQGRFEAMAAREPALHLIKTWVAGDLFWDAMETVTDALIPDSRHRAISTLLRIAGRKQGGRHPQHRAHQPDRARRHHQPVAADLRPAAARPRARWARPPRLSVHRAAGAGSAARTPCPRHRVTGAAICAILASHGDRNSGRGVRGAGHLGTGG